MYIRIGEADCYNCIYLYATRNQIIFKAFTPVSYEDMEEHIRDRVDFESEWREDVVNWYTTASLDEWEEDYEYRYEDYFEYDSDTDQYYQEEDSIYMSKDINYHCAEDILTEIQDELDGMHWFRWAENMDNAVLGEKIAEYYNECEKWQEEREEARKPHWEAFSYYK